MKRPKYYVRVMRPIFQRAILTVEATSDEAALHSALEQAERLTERDWSRLGAEREQPLIEIVLPEEEKEGHGQTDALDFLSEIRHVYALLQADLEAGEGAFIAPTWLRRQSALMVADITQDWSEALASISDAGAAAFYHWLSRQGHPANVVDFLAERDKRRGKPPQGQDADD